MLIGMVFFGEELDAIGVIGCVLILVAGVYSARIEISERGATSDGAAESVSSN